MADDPIEIAGIRRLAAKGTSVGMIATIYGRTKKEIEEICARPTGSDLAHEIAKGGIAHGRA